MSAANQSQKTSSANQNWVVIQSQSSITSPESLRLWLKTLPGSRFEPARYILSQYIASWTPRSGQLTTLLLSNSMNHSKRLVMRTKQNHTLIKKIAIQLQYMKHQIQKMQAKTSKSSFLNLEKKLTNFLHIIDVRFLAEGFRNYVKLSHEGYALIQYTLCQNQVKPMHVLQKKSEHRIEFLGVACLSLAVQKPLSRGVSGEFWHRDSKQTER